MEFESGLMQAFAKNRYGMMSSKQRRKIGEQNRAGKDAKREPNWASHNLSARSKNLGGASGSQAPNAKALGRLEGATWDRQLKQREIRHRSGVKKAVDATLIEKVGGKAGRANAFGTGKAASKKQQRTYMTNRQFSADFMRDMERSNARGPGVYPFQGKDGATALGRKMDQRIIGGKLRRAGSYSPMKKSLVERIDAEMIAKARYGFASSKQRRTIAMQNMNRKPRPNKNLNHHSLSHSEAPHEGHQDWARVASRARAEFRSGTDIGRYKAVNTLADYAGARVKRKFRKGIDAAVDAELIEKARYGLAGSAKQRNTSAMQRRAGKDAKSSVKWGADAGQRKNLGGATGSQAPDKQAAHNRSQLSLERWLIGRVSNKGNPDDIKYTRAAARRTLQQIGSQKAVGTRGWAVGRGKKS